MPASRQPAADARTHEGPGSALELRALVVDDDTSIRRTLGHCLRGLGCTVEEVASGREALRAARAQPFDLAFCDLRLERESGLDLIPRLVAELPALDVVVITAFAAVDTAVEAMRRGARDYLPKPFTPAQVKDHVVRARERRAAELRATGLAAGLDEIGVMVDSASPRMQAALAVLARAAAHGVSVLLRGEKGVGAAILARRLHAQSPRRGGPFVELRCVGAPEEEIATALLGRAHRGGAGGREGQGALERASGGTLFLDEVADLPGGLQDGLLRRLGERGPGDPRLVAFSSRDLDAEVRAGRFREELRYALGVVEVAIPALRERPEDLLPLARALVASVAARAGRPAPALSPAAEERLVAYAWPGNLRELRNAVERAFILTSGPEIGPECFPDAIATSSPQPVLGGRYSTEDIEREHVRRVLGWAGSLEEASRVLGVAVTTLWRKRKRWKS